MFRKMKSLDLDASYVTLNVGGKKFSTSIQTLKQGDNMLSAMFSGRIPLKREKDDSVFIDRDGTHFRSILNFLRDGVISKPNSRKEIEELKKEAEFYCIDGLIEICINFLRGEHFGDEYIKVWKSTITPGKGSISTYAQPSMTVPLMADGTMSLTYLRRLFLGAPGLCVNKYNNGIGSPEMLKIVGDIIYPPDDGWKPNDENRRYFVPPIYNTEGTT